jgi:hypothetical protein
MDNNLILNTIFFILGSIVTWYFSYRYYKKTVRKTELIPFIDYSSDILNTIDPEIKNRIKITYEDEIVNDLYELKFVVANTGNEAITNIKRNLVLNLPEEAELLSVDIMKIYPEDREINLELIDDETNVQFEFFVLNPGDYFDFKVLLKRCDNISDNEKESKPVDLTDTSNYFFTIESQYLEPTLAIQYLSEYSYSKDDKDSKELKALAIAGIISSILFGNFLFNIFKLLPDKILCLSFFSINFYLILLSLLISLVFSVIIIIAWIYDSKKKSKFKYIRN